MLSSVIEASFYCALFCVFMAHVRYNLEQRVFIYDCYVKKDSYKSCWRKFHCKFPDPTCPSGDKISKLVKKVLTHGILTDTKLLKRNRVLTEEKHDDIGHQLENSPQKSLWQLVQTKWCFCRQRVDSN
jgi:hypothetical protein